MIRRLAILLLGLALFIPRASALDQPFDHSVFDQLLKKFVNENGDVNYAALKKDPALLKQYLKQLRRISWMDMRDWPREELMAFWMNAYHAALIRNIVVHYPLKNTHEVPGFWDEDAINVGKRYFGLNKIRVDILFGSYRDPKIHTALSYAAKGGPTFPREAFTGPTIEGQLYKLARLFVNDASKNIIVPGGRDIKISKLFEWYPGDFTLSFGVFENDRNLSASDFAVLSFLAYYMENDAKVRYLEEGNYKIKYLPFDWSLNDWKTS